MDVYEAIRTRRDTESFSDEAPPREVIERLLEAANWAPNHKLTQPWRFFVLTGAGRERMGEAVATWLADPGREGGPGPEGAQRSARSKLKRAPVIVVIAQKATPDDAERDLEDYAACAAAIQNMLLVARAEGLAVHWSTGELAQYEGAKRFLGLEPHDRIVSYLNVGYPGAPIPERKPRLEPEVRWFED